MVISRCRDVRGALQLPLLVVLFLVTVSGFGAWGILRRWRFLAEDQLRLDRCVGEVARNLRDTLNTVESSNQRIRGLRASLRLAVADPPLIPPLEAALIFEVGKQEFYLLKWKKTALQWSLQAGCGRRRGVAWPLPDLRYHREPPDEIGPQALNWQGDRPQEFRLQVGHSPRFAAAVVKEKVSEGGFKGSNYFASWAVPQFSFRSGSH